MFKGKGMGVFKTLEMSIVNICNLNVINKNDFA